MNTRPNCFKQVELFDANTDTRNKLPELICYPTRGSVFSCAICLLIQMTPNSNNCNRKVS